MPRAVRTMDTGAAIVRFWPRDVEHLISPRLRGPCYASGAIRRVDTSPLSYPSGGIGGRDHGPASGLHAPAGHGGCQRIWCDDTPCDTPPPARSIAVTH